MNRDMIENLNISCSFSNNFIIDNSEGKKKKGVKKYGVIIFLMRL